MAASYRAAAKFIEKTRNLYPEMIFSSISGVGATALADELKLLGPRYTNGVIVTQVVPAVSGFSSAVLDYKNALTKYFPGEAPDYASLEGFVAANILIDGLKRTGRSSTPNSWSTRWRARAISTSGLGCRSALAAPTIRPRTRYGARRSTKPGAFSRSTWSKPAARQRFSIQTLDGAAEIAALVGKPRHRKARAVGTDPGFRIEQDPLSLRLPRKIHGQVGVEESPLAEIQHRRGAVAEICGRHRPHRLRHRRAHEQSAGRRDTRSRRAPAHRSGRGRRASDIPGRRKGSRRNPPARRVIGPAPEARPSRSPPSGGSSLACTLIFSTVALTTTTPCARA